MRVTIKWASLFLVLFSVFLLNPFWPIWGNEYIIYYEDGRYLNNTPSSLMSFLENNHYNTMNHFSALFGLICLYFGLILLIICIVIHHIKKKNNLLVSLFSSILLITSSIFLPFSCNYKSLPFVCYCILPFVCGVSIFLCDIVFIKTKKLHHSL